MKTLEEAHAALDRWWNENSVGNLIFFKAPHANHCDAIIESVIKVREMGESARKDFERFMSRFDADKGEFWRDKNGNPDRIKIVKGF